MLPFVDILCALLFVLKYANGKKIKGLLSVIYVSTLTFGWNLSVKSYVK